MQPEAAALEGVVDEVDYLDSENEEKPKKWKWDSKGGASARKRKTSTTGDAMNIIVCNLLLDHSALMSGVYSVGDPCACLHVGINVESDNQWHGNTVLVS